MATTKKTKTASKDSFRFRKNRQELKAAFVVALASIAPVALAELTECFPVPRRNIRRNIRRPLRKVVRPRRETGRAVFEWPAFDAWADKYGLRIRNPAEDWIRIWAASLDSPAVTGTTTSKRACSVSAAYNSAWRTEKRALEAAGIKTSVRDRRIGRQTARLAEATVRWQVLRQTWSAILVAMGLGPSRLADLHHGVCQTAETLSLKRRIGRGGRPKI